MRVRDRAASGRFSVFMDYSLRTTFVLYMNDAFMVSMFTVLLSTSSMPLKPYSLHILSTMTSITSWYVMHGPLCCSHLAHGSLFISVIGTSQR